MRIMPTLSATTAMQWAYQLRQFDFSERTSLSRQLRSLVASLKCRTMVVVLSDLHEPDAISALELVAATHELVVFWLEDPAESKAPPSGIFRAREAETGRRFFVDSPNPFGERRSDSRVIGRPRHRVLAPAN